MPSSLPPNHVGRYMKVNQAMHKKLPIQSDIPKLLVDTSYQPGTTEHQKATVDLTMIAANYLLRLWVGEYTIKGMQNNTKQTVFNSSMRMSRSSKKMSMANFDASHGMHHRITSPLPLLTEPHSN